MFFELGPDPAGTPRAPAHNL